MTDKESKVFLNIAGFKRFAREAPSRRLFKHVKKYPNLPLAQQHVKEYRKAWPRDPESMSCQAVLCLAQNKPHEALRLLEQATNLRPDMAKLWSNKAVAHVALKNTEKALLCAGIAIGCGVKTDPCPFNIKGVALAQLGKKAEAIRVLRHSLFLDECQAKTHRNLAAIYSACSMTTDAGKHYKRSLQIDPYFDKAYIPYTRCLVAIGKRNEALAVMEHRSVFYARKSKVKPVDHAEHHPISKYALPKSDAALSPGF